MDRRDPLDDPETWSDLSRRMVALSQRDARRRMEEANARRKEEEKRASKENSDPKKKK